MDGWRRGVATAAGAVAVLLLAGCGGGADAAGGGDKTVTLSLVSYSTPQAAFEGIIAAFQKTPEGQNVEFEQSYGASGDQSRAVEAGLPADIVEFSLEPDMARLVDAGVVSPEWNKNRYDGMVTESVVVIATRSGNPKDISDWPDLIEPDVEVVTPNPFTSGGARWNVMAAYGGALAEGRSERDAKQFLVEIFRHVPVQDSSARESLQTFVGGKGDAMLAYENEVIFAQDNGQELDYTVPDDTILIENPIAVTETSEHPREAQAFLDFLYTGEAQQIFSENGYRPVVDNASAREFPTPSGLFDITKFGGWSEAASKFFDPESGFLVDIENELGVPTSK
jgi:sulfate/thiosulfate transport system substrate-binding protein